MLTLLAQLDAARYVPRFYVVAATDAMGQQKAEAIERRLLGVRRFHVCDLQAGDLTYFKRQGWCKLPPGTASGQTGVHTEVLMYGISKLGNFKGVSPHPIFDRHSTREQHCNICLQSQNYKLCMGRTPNKMWPAGGLAWGRGLCGRHPTQPGGRAVIHHLSLDNPGGGGGGLPAGLAAATRPRTNLAHLFYITIIIEHTNDTR